jgi:hypothetical protein
VVTVCPRPDHPRIVKSFALIALTGLDSGRVGVDTAAGLCCVACSWGLTTEGVGRGVVAHQLREVEPITGSCQSPALGAHVGVRAVAPCSGCRVGRSSVTPRFRSLAHGHALGSGDTSARTRQSSGAVEVVPVDITLRGHRCTPDTALHRGLVSRVRGGGTCDRRCTWLAHAFPEFAARDVACDHSAHHGAWAGRCQASALLPAVVVGPPQGPRSPAILAQAQAQAWEQAGRVASCAHRQGTMLRQS